MQRKKLSIIAILIGSLAVLMACAGSSAATTSGGSTHGSTTTAPKNYKVGQAAKLGGYTIVVNSIKSSSGGEFDTLKTGDTFVVVDVTITNGTGKAQDFSSVLSFQFQGSDGQKYDETIITGATSPDGTISSGGKLRGQLAYETPKSVKKFTLAFQPDLLNTDEILWDLSY